MCGLKVCMNDSPSAYLQRPVPLEPSAELNPRSSDTTNKEGQVHEYGH